VFTLAETFIIRLSKYFSTNFSSPFHHHTFPLHYIYEQSLKYSLTNKRYSGIVAMNNN